MEISTITFEPLISWPWIASAAALILALLALCLARGGKGVIFRGLTLVLLTLALLNPRIVSETREAQPDVAVVVVDQSASQKIGMRQEQSEAALIAVQAALSRFANLEVKVVHSSKDGPTNLFSTLARAVGETAKETFAGALLITDGQVHDGPTSLSPLHVLLTGARDESDRRLIIEKAPSYGIVGKQASIVYRIEDRKVGAKEKTTEARFYIDGKLMDTAEASIGESQVFTFTLNHAGKTVVELRADPIEGELSNLNNRAAVAINGVRDRLKVLLVSGQPYSGERAWRNLLKSDPAVDLIHFTILRTMDKAGFIPLRELALIVFPIEELFDRKLNDFDLIVFDRYVLRNILPPSYMSNIKNFLLNGGGVLVASGPEFAGQKSLFKTVLGEIMPAKPSGRIMERGFTPELTEAGRRHPVTAGLSPPMGRPWGRWFRQIEVTASGGATLLKGPDDNPLLVLQRVGKGRIAQMMSDHIWLWARGFEGGGPHGEIMRRIAHWLMKEPDLEEESLKANVKGGLLSVQRRSLSAKIPEIKVTSPSGRTFSQSLKEDQGGGATALIAIDEAGLYRVNDGTKTALAAAGPLNPLEYADLRATDQILAPIAKASGGGVSWIVEGLPNFRRVRPGRNAAGRGWIGFRENQSLVVTGMGQTSLASGLALLIMILGALALAWRREGK